MQELKFSETMLEEVINDPKTQELIKTSIQKSIADAIADSFRSYGDMHKAIENKIKTVLVPYIEKYDITTFIPKLDAILSDIVSSTTLMDNKTILENFKELMIEPDKKTVTLEEVFTEYCKYMADVVDTADLEVITDDYPSYECFTCNCSVENTTPSWSNHERIDVEFSSEHGTAYGEDATIGISLRKWSYTKDDAYDIIFDKDLSVSSLRDLNPFEVYLLKLSRAGVKISDLKDLEEEVEPTAEPEASWS